MATASTTWRQRLAMVQRLVSPRLFPKTCPGGQRRRETRRVRREPFDPAEPSEKKRVHKGGSFLCNEQYCTRYIVGTRGKGEVNTGSNHLGFRCVQAPRDLRRNPQFSGNPQAILNKLPFLRDMKPIIVVHPGFHPSVALRAGSPLHAQTPCPSVPTGHPSDAPAAAKPRFSGQTPDETLDAPDFKLSACRPTTIDSDYGVFTADGNAMLMRRVAEIQGIAALQAMSQTSEFTQAAAQAAARPLNVAQDLITNPLPTLPACRAVFWAFSIRPGRR